MRRFLLHLIVLTCAAASPHAFADAGRCLARAAAAQVGVTLHYDPGYARIAYPGGDVAPDRGVCTDVVVRAYRRFGIDLQQRVHEDMRVAWDGYPKHWGLSRPDPNIDHRRVPNLAHWFGRHGTVLPVAAEPAGFAAGDIVTWRLASGVPHIGIVSEHTAASGAPMVVHHIGAGTQVEDMLFDHVITGHYRYLPDAVPEACDAAVAP